jgi:Concanavalin A-like lectin/glucanases superfamily
MAILLLQRGQTGIPIVQAGLVVYYRFDEGAGQTVADHSGAGNSGTLGSTSGADTNDPSWVAEGLSFTTDDYMATANDASTLPDAWTVCAAVKFDPAVADQPLVAWGAIGSARPGVYLSFLGSPYRPIIYQGASNFRYFKANDPVNLQDNGWHFMVYRSPGGGTADISNASLRVDGSPQVVDSTTNSGTGQSKTEFRLSGLGNKYLEGAVAFFTLHNRVLGDGEADQMHEVAREVLAGRVTLP